jgi:hypothetical protein
LVGDLAAQYGAEVLEAQAESPADERVRRPEEAAPVPRPDEHEHGVDYPLGADVGLEVAPALQLRRRLQAAEPWSVTIFGCRPPWHPNLTEWSEVPVAQLRYSAGTRHWSLHWADRNGRWHRYDDLDPGPVDKLLNEIEADPTCIFWG